MVRNWLNRGIIGYLIILVIGQSLLTGCHKSVVIDGQHYDRTLHVLSIGNSYSQDAFAYVPFIFDNMGIPIDFTIGMMVLSSASLKDHVDRFDQESFAYSFYLSEGGCAWQSFWGKKSIQWVLANYKWDIVILQQSSSNSFIWSSYQPYLDSLVNDICTYVSYPIQFGWLLTPSRPAMSNGGQNWDEDTIVSHYLSISECAENVLKDTECEFVIPVGTAIQNARTINEFRSMGDYSNNQMNSSGNGYLMAFDGVHLQEGLPSQIAAYSCVLSLLDANHVEDYSILGESTIASASWADGKRIPGPHGSYIGATRRNCEIAQMCALMAQENPYLISNMNFEF